MLLYHGGHMLMVWYTVVVNGFTWLYYQPTPHDKTLSNKQPVGLLASNASIIAEKWQTPSNKESGGSTKPRTQTAIDVRRQPLSNKLTSGVSDLEHRVTLLWEDKPSVTNKPMELLTSNTEWLYCKKTNPSATKNLVGLLNLAACHWCEKTNPQ